MARQSFYRASNRDDMYLHPGQVALKRRLLPTLSLFGITTKVVAVAGMAFLTLVAFYNTVEIHNMASRYLNVYTNNINLSHLPPLPLSNPARNHSNSNSNSNSNLRLRSVATASAANDDAAAAAASTDAAANDEVSNNQPNRVTAMNELGKARVLMGVFCRSTDTDYQEMFRALFSLHPAVCSLGRYERDLLHKSESSCKFIYTFVIGGSRDEDAPTELLDSHRPLVLEKGGDRLVLNIKESMNDGKSQTWLHFASTVMSDEHLAFDYVGKMDTDSLVYLDQYFNFADSYLHPSPYNLRTMVGLLSNKSEWRRQKSNENFFKRHYPERNKSLHLYPRGTTNAYYLTGIFVYTFAYMFVLSNFFSQF